MHILAIILMSVMLTACGAIETLSDGVNGVADYFFGTDNSEPPAVLTEYKPEVTMEVVWKESIGKGPGEKYLKWASGCDR